MNLPKKSFETLYENIQDGDLKVQSIRLIRAVDDKLTPNFRTEFSDFRKELLSMGIHADLHVIIDRAVAATIHGRYIYSKDIAGKDIRIHLPPLNSLKGDQWDTIFTDLRVGPPFEPLWLAATDIISEWNKVARAVTKHLKHKDQQKGSKLH